MALPRASALLIFAAAVFAVLQILFSHFSQQRRRISTIVFRDEASVAVDDLASSTSVFPFWTNPAGTMQKSIKFLESPSIRYYVYDDLVIKLNEIHEKHLIWKDPDMFDNLGVDAEAEITILNALKRHPLRTYNISEATLFIIPISFAAVKAALLNDTLEKQVYDAAFATLERQPSFRERHGHAHIVVSLWYAHFEHRFQKIVPYASDALIPYYDRLWNVTVADYRNKAGIQVLYESGKHPDFQTWFSKEHIQTTRSTFSIGLVPSRYSVPLLFPSFQRFQSARYNFFYHVRPTKFWTPNSTLFRRAALHPEIVQALSPSSIGNGLPKTTWEEHFQSSKFCLVTRGDDPSTHALLRSVRVGCIPVVVSDAYLLYAPSMPHSLSMQDYCIFIKEADFIENPLRELSKVLQHGASLIQEKLAALAMAQRMVLPDHPSSLFVPAFLHEAQLAMDHGREEAFAFQYRKRIGANDTFLLPYQKGRYSKSRQRQLSPPGQRTQSHSAKDE